MLTDNVEQELEMLRRHMTVLLAVSENEPIGILKLSEVTGYANHKVRYSLRILEQENLIEPSPQGAITTPDITEFLQEFPEHLRQIIETTHELQQMTE